MKRLSIAQTSKRLGVSYDTLWLALKSGRIPDRLVQKEFTDTGSYVRKTFYETDVEDIRQAFISTQPSRAKRIKPFKSKLTKAEIGKIGARARWDKTKPVTNGATSDRVAHVNYFTNEQAIWLIKNGHADAGIALLTEYRP